MKKISVITPTYNGSKFIKQNVESVINSLTFDKFEIEHIIVDDASTDQTAEILEQIEKPNLKKFFLPKNLGICGSRNFAIDNSDSDYIFALDQDDILTQTGLLYLFNNLDTENKDWAYGNSLSVNENLSYLIGKDFYGWDFYDSKEMATSILTGKHVILSTFMLSRNSLEKVGKYNSNLRRQDNPDLFLRLILAAYEPKFVYCTTILRRLHSNNTSKDLIERPEMSTISLRPIYELYAEKLKKFLAKEQISEIEKYLNIR